jgi:uncharacterized SAM-binding protein YcdF (DUF218 family)
MSRFSDSEGEKRQRLWSTARWLLGGALGLYIFSFILFAESLSNQATQAPQADGIVVLTGGTPARIEAGLALLAAKQGQRLLITGVYKDLDFETVLAMTPQQTPRQTETLRCCLDLDYKARNTVANARESRQWADVHGFRSLIVVTSAQHMPRAFLELRHAMPKIRLSAYPVVVPQVKLQYWFAYPGTMALLLGEYTRFLWALTGLTDAR